jgi:hypothetical protein
MSRSPIVCNGKVVSLENTLEKSSIYYPGFKSNPLPLEIWKARIKVLSTSKGKVPDEIEVRFTQIDQHPVDNRTTVIADGPIEIRFMTGLRYRLFLQPVPGQSWYLGALDGDFDDGYAVQPLADIEPDDSPPPLSREEAIQFAADYVKKIEPNVDISTIPPEASSWDGKWTVEFWSPPARSHEAPATAVVEVVGNRQVARGTWIADFCTTSVSDLKPGDIGRRFWVYMQMYPKDKKFYTMATFPPMIVLARLKAIRPNEVDLSDVWQRDTSLTWPTLTVPVQDVHWFLRLNIGAVPQTTPPQ